MKPWIRPAVACVVAAAAIIAIGRVYDDHRRISEARRALSALAVIQESYRAEHGVYASDLGVLAEQTQDAFGFVSSLDKILDISAGIVVKGGAQDYHLEARARDRGRTVVVLDGPPRRSMAEAGRSAKTP